MLLDIPTILITLVLINILSSVAIFWAWIEHPTIGQRKWALSLLLESASILLMLTQGRLTPLISVVGAYVLITTAFVFRYLSLCEFFERPSRYIWSIGPILLTIVSSTLAINEPVLRIVTINVLIAVQSGVLLYLAATSSISGVNYSRKMLIIYASLVAGIFLTRAVVELANDNARATLIEGDLFNSISLLVLLLLAVLSSFSILLILREKLDAENRRLATRDPLTGISNRRALIELAERELLRSYRTNRWPCLLMLDIDHFKQVNDRYGHIAGDQVLVALAQLVTAKLRDLDVVGRYGGEEFCILLAETDEEGGMVSAERLREAIAGMEVSTAHGNIRITVSIGLAHGRSGETLDQLISRADAALYEAKAQGRNDVIAARA